MKKLFILIIIMTVSSAILFTGCKKEEEEETPPTSTNILTAQIDGIAFSATMPLAQMALGIIQISGSNSAGSIQILLDYQVTTETVNVTDNTEEAIYWSSGQDSYWPGTGTIIVTNHDVVNNIIEGTFTASLEEFSTSAVVSVTNGVFNVTYIEQ